MNINLDQDVYFQKKKRCILSWKKGLMRLSANEILSD